MPRLNAGFNTIIIGYSSSKEKLDDLEINKSQQQLVNRVLEFEDFIK